jgi:uncharacterized protein (DUF362 family)/ferredoxin
MSHTDFRLSFVEARTEGEIRSRLKAELTNYLDLFPAKKDARILLKPNLNSNMNALTGNTTDLRIIAAVVEFLKEHGYTHISIGEGTNSGFYRNQISVIQRLKISELGKHYGVQVIDLNYAEGVDVPFENGIIAQVAKPVVDADFLINLPKLKMHFEVGITSCLKNLMGTLVGQQNKKKAHDSLCKNILNINRKVKPHLQILDGLIAMEGNGPTRGTPIRMDTILVGTNPYLMDLTCAYLAEFNPSHVRLLKEAEAQGLITPEYHDFVKGHPVYQQHQKMATPKVNPIVGFIHSPKRQKFFLKIRNTAFFNAVCNTDWAQEILFKTGLRQDKFLKEELVFENLTVNNHCVPGCTVCRDICPVSLELPKAFKSSLNGCIQCMYCYSVCPTQAIEFHGSKGFFEEQEKQYAEIIRKIMNS